MFYTHLFTRCGALLIAGVGLSMSVQADDGRAVQVPRLPKYQQECASCHVAYPPGLLAAKSWRRIMRGLPNHFGTDASLDPATVKQLSMWLEQHVGTGKRGQTAPP
jgi:hypothetical protein